VLAVSVVIGLVRGFVFEVMSLAGLAGGLVRRRSGLAPSWRPPADRHARLGAATWPPPSCCAFSRPVVWGLLAKLVRLLIHATPLSLPDRLLGAGFGLLRGGVLLLAWPPRWR
jgi:membrane protein required for colicin V production